MADFPGIKPVTPTYPVRPTQPANKDREPGRRQREKQDPEKNRTENDRNEKPGRDPDDQTHIDEHV